MLVNPTIEEIKKFSNLNLDYFQIYGDYNDKKILEIKSKYMKKIIVALQIKNKSDVLNYKKVEKSADIILWDSSGYEESLSWDYNWIKSISTKSKKMVAGNITIDKLTDLVNLADIIDVSGALETNKVKDINKIKKFITEIKKIKYAN